MIRRIRQRLPNLRKRNLHLLHAIPHDLRSQKNPKPLQALLTARPVKHPNLLEFRVLRPRPQRDFIRFRMNRAREAYFLKPCEVLAVFGRGERPADFVSGGEEEVRPPGVDVFGREGVVVPGGLAGEFGVLDPAAGLEGAEGLGVERGPVGDAAEHVADVDEVEGGGLEGPGEAGVVEFEAAVGRGPFGLDWGEVGADY